MSSLQNENATACTVAKSYEEQPNEFVSEFNPSKEIVKENLDLFDPVELRKAYHSDKPAFIETPEGKASFEEWCARNERKSARAASPEAVPDVATEIRVTLTAHAFDKKALSQPPETLIARVASDEFEESIQDIRQKYSEVLAATGDLDKAKKSIKALKEALPAVTWSGEFSSLKKPVADKLIRHSGLFCADLDHLGDRLNDVRVALLESEHLWSIFLSPSGDGLKAIFRVPKATALQHKRCLFPAVRAHVLALTGEEIDGACCEVGRLCFLSFDLDASVNDDAMELPVDLTIPEEPEAEKSAGLKPSKEQVRSMLAAIPPKPDYELWIRIIWAVGDALDESDAIDLLEKWSPEGDGRYSYENMLSQRRDTGERVTISTLFHLAHEHGWKMPYIEPPLDILPNAFRKYVEQASASLAVDKSFILLPLLSSLGSIIGNARSIELKDGYVEPPILWTALVAESGQKKSPAIEAGTFLVGAKEREMDALNRGVREAYKEELAAWSGQSQKTRGKKPEEPTYQTCSMDDLTLEALVDALEQNQRGILVSKDELSHWFESFDQYRDGKGSDVARWLSLHTGVKLGIDRKTDRRRIRLFNPRVCITGGIQPNVLRRSLTRDFFERGLPARFIFAAPPERHNQWSEETVSHQIRQGIENCAADLWLLEPDDLPPTVSFATERKHPRPVKLTLTAEAKEIFVEFYNGCGAFDGSQRGKAAFNKLPAFAARLALVGQLARDPDARAVTGEVMEAACALAQWSGNEALRIYGLFSQTKEQRDQDELLAFIEKHGGTVTLREVMRSGPRGFRQKETAGKILDELVDLGRIERKEEKPENGGPPTAKFILKKAL